MVDRHPFYRINKTMTKNNTLYYSINKNWINKFDPDKDVYKTKFGKEYNLNISRGWINVGTTVREMVELISNGYAFCTQLTTNKNEFIDVNDLKKWDEDDYYFNGAFRKDKNFYQTNLIALDYDNGFGSIEDITNLPFFKEFGLFYYTSASHDPKAGKIKCRLVFRIEKTITDKDDYLNLMRGILVDFGEKIDPTTRQTLKRGADNACKDAARIFYGSKDCDWQIINEDNYIPHNIVKEFIKKGKESNKNVLGYATTDKLTTKDYISQKLNAKTIAPHDYIKLKDGTTIQFKELTTLFKQFNKDLNRSGKIISFCPFHDDKMPSAFVSITEHNHAPYLYCSKCSNEINGGKAFFMSDTTSEFEKKIAELKARTDKKKATVINIDERYLQELPTDDDGIIYIKSAKGTGKTTALIKKVKQWKKEKKKVLLLGHRVSLLNAMSEKLGLDFYKDGEYTRGVNSVYTTDNFALCINSLWRVQNFDQLEYDVIIIDECEQVLENLAAKTIDKKHRHKVITRFVKLLKKSKTTMLLDADLGLLTTNFFENEIALDERFTFLHNKFKKSGESFNIYVKKQQLIDDMLVYIKNNIGKKVAIFANSKKFILEIEELLKETHGDNVKLLTITQDNSNSEKIQNIIKNIDKELENYDVFLGSPSINTGLDVQIPFDNEFGFYESYDCSSTHLDIDQQMFRIRKSAERNIWISSRYGNKETESDKILERIIFTNDRNNDLIEYNEGEQDLYSKIYIRLHAEILAKQARSTNQLLNNWLGYQIENGVDIKVVDKDAESKQQYENYKLSSKEGKARYYKDLHELLNQPCDLSYDEYLELKNSKTMTVEKKLKMENWEVQKFFKLDRYDNAFLGMYMKGLKMDVINLENFEKGLTEIIEKDLIERENDFTTPDRQQNTTKFLLLKQIIMEELGITFEQQLIDFENINKTVKFILENVDLIETTLKIKVGKDIEAKPMRTINRIMGKAGLNIESKKVRDGDDIRMLYIFDKDYYNTIKYFIKIRLINKEKMEQNKEKVMTKKLLDNALLNVMNVP